MIAEAQNEILLPPRDFVLRVSIGPNGARYVFDGRELSITEAATLVCAMSDDLNRQSRR